MAFLRTIDVKQKYILNKILKYTIDRRIQLNIKRDVATFWSYVKQHRKNNEQAIFGEMTSDQVAKEFSNYFSSVFLPDHPALDVHAALQYWDTSHQLISIDHIDDNDIRVAIKRLAPKNTQGPDFIPQYIVRDCCEAFIKPLSYIFNLSIKTNTYPVLWKISKVLPIHKSGSKSDFNNYRPIAVISVFGKVFETVLYKKIHQQLRGWFTDSQHGFL